VTLKAIQIAIVTLVCFVLAYVTQTVRQQTDNWILLWYWYIGAAVIGGCLIAFVIGRRYTNNPMPMGRILCIIPAYNEDPEGLRKTVLAIMHQTVPVDIVVIDDGSHYPVVPCVNDPSVKWLRQDNTGKRGAQCTVLKQYHRDDYQFIMTVDSDSEPYPDACEQLLRALWNPNIQAATGMIYIRNYSDTWISMAADLDIGTSCVMMRASRSMLGALETTSGALALYRSELLYDHLDAYAVECGTGDDRWLALRALRRGQVVAVAEAMVETDMPTTLKGTYKQRLRWSRSWWWMIPYVFKFLRRQQLLSPLYGVTQLLVTPLLLMYIIVATALTFGSRYLHHWGILFIYFIAYCIVRYALSALYLIGRPRVPRSHKVLLFLIGTPAAIFLNMILLMPTRYIALFKLMDNRWQTRDIPPSLVSSNK
jgi:hyaluronan synthase